MASEFKNSCINEKGPWFMKNKKSAICILAAGIAALCAAMPVFAHHGTAAFDTSKMVTVTGTVTDFQFVNPHVQVYWACKNDKGETEMWQGELTAPNKLIRAGWEKHTLKPGDQVTVSGYQSQSGAHVIWIRKLIGPTGESLPTSEE
jgi:hypothetical protein